MKSMSQITDKPYVDYEKARQIKNPKYLCHAPFANMYLNSQGNIGACWLTLERAPRYPELSLREIWFGEYFERLRSNIKSKNLKELCSVCDKKIHDGVYSTILARAYDIDFELQKYPSIMEFELSNLCNLACVMCKGSLSSKIRKDREQLPALKSPYDEKFVMELEEFLPHLQEARFNGGEPFLQQICWQIWEKIADVNPKILITVATNGTILTDKMKSIMERCRFRVNVSIDSLDAETYASIRVNSNLEQVVNNLGFYSDYCDRKETILSVLVNPMRMNWREMPRYVRWCTDRKAHFWMNTVWRPRHLALWTLPSKQLEMIKKTLETDTVFHERHKDQELFDINLGVLRDFVNQQLDGWIRDQKLRETQGLDYSSLISKQKGSAERFRQREVYRQRPEIFDRLQERTSKVFSSETMYYFLDQQSDQKLRDYLFDRDFDSATEWIYHICDYY